MTDKRLRSFSDTIHLTLEFHAKLGYWPNLWRPKTFNEKLLRRKIKERDPYFSTLVDKLAVKDVVAGLVGDDWVTPTLWRGFSLPPRSLRSWPKPYVIKANHGSGYNH